MRAYLRLFFDQKDMSPKPQTRNSAGRLLTMLQSIRVQSQMLDFLPDLIDGKKTTAYEKQQSALMALMELHKVYMEFRQDMMEANINEHQREVMLNGLRNIERSIYPVNLNASFQQISEAEASLLSVCAAFIPEEGELLKEDVDKVREAIKELRNLVENGEISPVLRKSLLELIRLAEDAIARFNIHGAKGLRKAFKRMLGEASEAYGLTKSSDEVDVLEKSSTWLAVVTLLKAMDAVASKVLKYKPLLEGAARILIGA